MYRLMKSAKFTLDHMVEGPVSSYRQSLVALFRQPRAALVACKLANGKGANRHYVLNASGQEYFDGVWVD
jgi:hypothetical protein